MSLLTSAQIKKVQEKNYTLSDGQGLQLLIKINDTKI